MAEGTLWVDGLLFASAAHTLLLGYRLTPLLKWTAFTDPLCGMHRPVALARGPGLAGAAFAGRSASAIVMGPIHLTSTSSHYKRLRHQIPPRLNVSILSSSYL